jgi:hypothetical protein
MIGVVVITTPVPNVVPNVAPVPLLNDAPTEGVLRLVDVWLVPQLKVRVAPNPERITVVTAAQVIVTPREPLPLPVRLTAEIVVVPALAATEIAGTICVLSDVPFRTKPVLKVSVPGPKFLMYTDTGNFCALAAKFS